MLNYVSKIKSTLICFAICTLCCLILGFSVNTAMASEYENFDYQFPNYYDEFSPANGDDYREQDYDPFYLNIKSGLSDYNNCFENEVNLNIDCTPSYVLNDNDNYDFEPKIEYGKVTLRHNFCYDHIGGGGSIVDTHAIYSDFTGKDIHVVYLKQIDSQTLRSTIYVKSHTRSWREQSRDLAFREIKVDEKQYCLNIHFSKPILIDESLLNKDIDINIDNQSADENTIFYKPLDKGEVFTFKNENPDLGSYYYNDSNFNEAFYVGEKPLKSYNVETIDNAKKIVNLIYDDNTVSGFEVKANQGCFIKSFKINGSEEPVGYFDDRIENVFNVSFAPDAAQVHYWACVENEWLPIYDLNEPTGSLYYSCNYVVKQNSVWQGVSYTINYYDSSVDISNPANYRYVDPIAVMEINPGQVLDRTGFDCIGFSADNGCFLPYTDDDGEYLTTDTEGNFIGKVGAGGNVYLTFGKSSYGTSQNTILDCFMRCFNNQQNESDRAPYGMEYRLEKIGARSFIVKN